MDVFKTNAIVIERSDFSETSQIVTFFTRNSGRIESIAKGIRRPKATFEGALDLLDVVEIVFSQKDVLNLAVLRESTLLESFDALRSDPVRYTVACCMVEIVREITRSHDPNPELYDAFLASLRAAAAWLDPVKPLWAFVLKALSLTGFMPPLDRCSVCSSPISKAREVAFSVSKGGPVCSNCAPSTGEVIRASGETLSVLRAFASRPLDGIRNVKSSRTCEQQLRLVIDALLAVVFSRRLKSLEFLPS